MSSILESASLNSTLYEALILQIEETFHFISEFFTSCILIHRENIPKLFADLAEVTVYDQLAEYLYFNEFQLILLKTFFLIFIVTLVLIFISWRVYGKRIYEGFMKPASLLAIEQLKESVARLKLPKEYTPRL